MRCRRRVTFACWRYHLNEVIADVMLQVLLDRLPAPVREELQARIRLRVHLDYPLPRLNESHCFRVEVFPHRLSQQLHCQSLWHPAAALL